MPVGLVLFAVLIGVGYAARRLGFEWLVRPVVYTLLYVIIPVAVVRAYALHGLSAFTSYSLVALACFLASAPYAMLVAVRLCGSRRECRASVLLTLLFPNTVFLPLSLAPILGLDVDVIVSYALPLTLLHFTLGYRLGGVEPRRGIPLLVSAAAATGLALNASGVAGSLAQLWSLAGILGRMAGYLSILVVGASLPEPHRVRLRDPLLAASIAWRSTASPLLHYLAASILGVTHGLATLMVESVMAPATMNAVIARHIGADYERIATVILVHTPLAALEAALLVTLLGSKPA